MTRYTFGEIAENIKDKRKPVKEDKDTYIGLEHLDHGSLCVTRWGSEAELKGEKLCAKKGDVLFGRRNTYLKRVAIAPFDCLFSAHGLILRPKEEVITKEYFPFFLSSDYFMNEAIRISVGSLSPTVNWSDLKELEFDLPPLEEQKRLAEILWSAEELKQKIIIAIKETKRYLETYIEHTIFNPKNKSVCIKELVEINKNSVPTKLLSEDYAFSYIDIGSISRPKYLDLDLVKTYTSFKEAPGRARRCVDEGDILMSSVRPNLQSFAIVPKGKYIASTGFVVMKPKAKHLRNIIFFSLFTSRFMKYCDGFTTGSNYPAISSGAVGKFTINLPAEEESVIISEILDKIQRTIDSLVAQEQTLIRLEKSLLN